MAEPADKRSSIETSIDSASPVETVSPPVRQYRSALFQLALFLAIGVFALLTMLVKTTPSFAIDLQITYAIQSIASPLFAGFMRLISWPGFLPQSILITVMIAFVLYLYRLRWEAVVSLLAALLSGTTNELVKRLIGRPRPSAEEVDVFAVLDSFSFPSGHVMFYTILFGFTWYLIYTLLKRSWARSILLGFFGVFILLVGVSRIHLGQHWASDVLGAYLLGGLLLVFIVFLYQSGKQRFFVNQQAVSSNPKKE